MPRTFRAPRKPAVRIAREPEPAPPPSIVPEELPPLPRGAAWRHLILWGSCSDGLWPVFAATLAELGEEARCYAGPSLRADMAGDCPCWPDRGPVVVLRMGEGDGPPRPMALDGYPEADQLRDFPPPGRAREDAGLTRWWSFMEPGTSGNLEDVHAPSLARAAAQIARQVRPRAGEPSRWVAVWAGQAEGTLAAVLELTADDEPVVLRVVEMPEA